MQKPPLREKYYEQDNTYINDIAYVYIFILPHTIVVVMVVRQLG